MLGNYREFLTIRSPNTTDRLTCTQSCNDVIGLLHLKSYKFTILLLRFGQLNN